MLNKGCFDSDADKPREYILCVPERSYQNFDSMLLKK